MSVPAEKTPTFETVALERGLVTAEQVAECREIQKKVAEAGLESTVEEVLLKKGYLTKQQAAAINSMLGKGVKTAIEGYTILEKVAQGGMGAVYKAKQTSMDRVVAIKVLLPKFAKEKSSIERFLREAKAIARLSHPNIVAGIDAGYSNGIYYYVMEYLDGESMDKVVKRRGMLHWSEAVPIVHQIAAALDHAHRQGFVHRDIKPGNILFLKDGTAKLADLGLARAASGEDIYVTQTGVILGTPAYLSPEQARGEKTVDIRSDIYSLGITFFEFLHGAPPFQSDNALVVVTKHTTTDVPTERLASVPPEVRTVLAKMCSRDKRQRYQDPAELLADLDAVLKGKPLVHARMASSAAATTVLPPPLFQAPRRPRLAGMTAVLMALTVLALAVGLSSLVVPWKRLLGIAEAPKPPAPGPGPGPRTTPPPIPDPMQAERERRVREEFELALDYEQKNPTRIEDVIALYRAMVKSSEGTPTHAKVVEKVDTLSARLSAMMKSSEEELDWIMKRHESDGAYSLSQAAAEKASTHFQDASWKRRMQEKADGVVSRARTAYDALMKEVDGMVSRKEWAEAQKRLGASRFGIAQFDQGVRTRLEEVTRASQEGIPAEDRDRKHDTELVARTVPLILEDARLRRFNLALGSADRLVDALRTVEAKGEAQLYLAWITAASKFYQGASDGMERLRPGEKVTLDLRGERIEGMITSAGRETVTLRTSTETRTLRLSELAAESLVWLYERPVNGRSQTADRRCPGLVSILDADRATAEKYMEIVLQAGYQVPPKVLEAYRALQKK